MFCKAVKWKEGDDMSISRKELVLNAMDRKEVERVPAGFWFHFLDDEIHADAYTHPELEKKVLDGELHFIEESQPDFVKIMTDGFFSYPNPVVQKARTAAELAKVQPLPDDHPFFTRQVAYAKEITKRYGSEIATFYNLFCAGTTIKFMQPGTLAEDEAFLARLVREDKAAVRAAFDVISGDLAKLADRIIREAGVTGIYFSLQNLVGEGADRAVYEEVFAPGEKEILRVANAASPYNILHICGYAGHRNELEWYRDYDAKTINWAAVVEGVPLEEGRKVFPAHALLGGFGNLATDVLYSGTRAEVEAETQRILAAAGRTGVILGADCTVPRDIDWNRFAWVRGAAGAR